MTPSNSVTLSNIDIVVYALYLLGGWHERIHTEDIALKCFELAPSRFSWIKYPNYPDNHTAYLSLGDAKKQKYGSLVEGESERKKERTTKGIPRFGGWKLTLRGVEWLETNKARIEMSLGKRATIGKRLDTDRKLQDLINSMGFRKFMKDGEQADISHAVFAESLVCTVNTPPETLNERLDQLHATAEILKRDDVKRYLRFCRKKFSVILKWQ
ncbi:MAG: hypothetical protein U0X92_04480 [Anaerolineales bacterium]